MTFTYADELDPNLISYDGSITLLDELGVDPASVDVLPLSFYLESPALGQFTRSEFLNGWLRLGVGVSPISDQEELRRQQRQSMARVMDAFRANAPVVPKFKSTEKASSQKGLYTAVYEYTFAFARAEGQKNLRMYLDVLTCSTRHGSHFLGAPATPCTRLRCGWH